MPAGIIAISPWTDLTSSGESYTANEKVDPSMTKERLRYFSDCYAYGAEKRGIKLCPKINPDKEDDIRIKSDYRMSPIFGNLDKMPPSLIFVGGDEIMLDDSVKMHESCLRQGR